MELGQWVDGDLYNGRIVRISNNFVFKEPVFNYSADFPFLWDEIKIPITYGSDYKQTKIILEKVAKEVIGDYVAQAQLYWENMLRKFLIEAASTIPMVTMVATDNWIEFTLRYVVDIRRRRVVKDKLFTKIMSEVEKYEGTIEFASATFQIVEASTLDVNLKNKNI